MSIGLNDDDGDDDDDDDDDHKNDNCSDNDDNGNRDIIIITNNDNNDKNNGTERRYWRLCHHLLTAPRAVSNTYTQVARSQPCANHAQHIRYLSRATCPVPRGTNS